MDAQFINYEEPYPPIQQYAETAENSVLDSDSFVNDTEGSEYQSPEQLRQDSWLQQIKRKLAHRRSNRKRKARKTAIAKSSENSAQESRWQRFKRFFSRQKPTEISTDTDPQKSFTENSENSDTFYTQPPVENSTFTEESFTGGTKNSDSSSLEPSISNAINDADSFADDYSNSESSAPELYEQQADQDSLGRPSSFELSTSRQPAPVRSSDEFEQTLKIYAQQISSGEYNVTKMPHALIDLYNHNAKYLNNPWYTQVIENLLSNWVSQVANIGRKMFRKCHWEAALTPDFMNFLATIDHFLSEAAAIDTLRKSQAFQDLIAIVNMRFIDWFKLLIQTPGVNPERFFSMIHDYWGRFHSVPMKQLMIRISDLSNNDDHYIY